MFKKSVIIILLFFLFAQIVYAKGLTITIVYNNVSYDSKLTTAWGISCFIEGLEKAILFDTGGNGSILLANMEKIGIDPKEVGIVYLSHIHEDHTGGLWSFLQENDQVIVYVPESFPKGYKDRVKAATEDVIPVREQMKICEDAWSTGEMGAGVKEQSLIINTEKGLVIITGCAHPGIVNIARQAKNMFAEEIFLLVGGFHLMSYNEEQINDIVKQLKQLGVKNVAPSHCTGDKAIGIFREKWGKNFLNSGCGAKIRIIL